MLQDLFAVLGLALLCAGWVWLQRVVQKVDPENPGLDRNCGACGCSEEGRCAETRPREDMPEDMADSRGG